jgi:DNA segregation ATPase FtsK/SpoIIIE, S-DNA-T family
VRIPVTVMLSGSGHDLFIEAAAGARVADLCHALAEHFGTAGLVNLSAADGLLDPDLSLAAAGVRAGVVLRTVFATADAGGPPAETPSRRPGLQVRVIAGPDAGLVVRLPRTGTATIGRSADNEVRLSGTAVSRRHATLRFHRGRAELSDAGSTHGSAVDGRKVTDWVHVTADEVVQIGDNRLIIHNGDRDGAADVAADVATTRLLDDGTLRLTRQHRFVEPPASVTVDMPRRPGESSRATAAVGGISAASGLILGLVTFLVWHNVMFLVFSLVGAGTLVTTAMVGWLWARRQRAREQRAYSEQVVQRREQLAVLLAAEQARRTAQAPDAVQVLLTAQRPGRRLWERRPTHEDFLEVRLGLADQPSAITVRDGDADQAPPVVTEAPVTVNLAAVGTVGLAGPRPQTRALARWIVAQAAVHSGPADLSIVVLTRAGDGEARQAWDWIRWLPHARPGTGALASVGSDEATSRAQVDALDKVVAHRRQSLNRTAPRRFAHNWLVVVDDLPEYDVDGLADVLTHGPEVGVFVLAIDQLPYRCPVTATFTDPTHLRLRRAGQPDLVDVLADQVSALVTREISRALAPLHDPEVQATGVALPAEVALLDLVPGDPAAVLDQWRRQPRQTRVVLGRTSEGPLSVDVVANGPHALVAGATGWGKSALLQSLIGSLAIANRPDELGFILVDFKGGAAFSAFARLPHTVGSISNLDGHQVMRALDSLAGEMDRRQRYLKGAGVEKLEEYQQLADTATLPPGCPASLPRLLVVIDEFAILKEQLPDEIMTRLVHVATIGRSLGLHLIIGTQTPRGVVPPEIRPNINLQIALHLPSDHSMDVVSVPDASTLTVKGRGYMRRGEETELILFQSAFLGGKSRRAPGRSVRVIRAPWGQLGYSPAEATGASDVRDVDLLVDAVCEAAAAAGITGPTRPWLADLPAALPLESLRPPSSDADPPREITLAYGREDQPEARAQPVAAWSLTHGTNLLVAGRPKSGRSTLLRTLAASAARSYRPHEVQLYVMDCAGALADLRQLPHCGAVVDHADLDRGARLLDRLERKIRDGRGPMPFTVLLIDDWETWQQTFGEVDSGALYDQLLRIVRKGPAAGVHVAITGTSALLSGGRSRPLAEASEDRLALPFDPTDYAWLGVPATALPAQPRPGQALRVTPPHRTVQIAVVGEDPDPGAQRSALRTLAENARAATVVGLPGPWRVDRIPEQITFAAAHELPRDSAASAPDWVPLGVGGDELRLLGADLATEGPGLFVVGARKHGRSSALLGIALDLVRRGTEVVVFAPVRTSPMHALSGVAGVAAILGSRQPTVRQAQLALAAAGTGPCVVLVDDADHLLRAEANAVLREFLLDADHARRGMVVAAGIDEVASPAPGSFLAEAGRTGTGLVLRPRSPRLHLFDGLVRIPQSYVRGEPAGRAVLIRPRGAAPVQVPYADPSDATSRVRKPSRTPELLTITDALAGAAPTTVDRLRAIVAELRESGFSTMDQPTVDHAVALVTGGWRGEPADLLAAAAKG